MVPIKRSLGNRPRSQTSLLPGKG